MGSCYKTLTHTHNLLSYSVSPFAQMIVIYSLGILLKGFDEYGALDVDKYREIDGWDGNTHRVGFTFRDATSAGRGGRAIA